MKNFQEKMLNITGIPFSFKNEGLDVNKLREKRSEKAVKLRKKKRDVSFDHQRDLNDFRAENMNSLIEIEYILQNGEKGHGEKFYAIKSFSTECKCHPEDVAKSGVAKVVLDFLDTQKSNPTMQNEILICFINATCWLKELPGKTFTENHGIESCMQILISTPYNDVRDNAIVLLDNIVQTSNAYRDKVLDFGILAHLLSLLQTSNCRDIQMNGVELLAHLSDEFFATDPRMISFKCCFPLLAKYLHHKDPKVLEFTMKTLSNLSLEIFFDEFIDGGFCPRLMQILDSKPPLDVIHSALNCIQSLTNEKNAMSQIFVSLNLLGVISKILRSPKDCYQKNFFEKKSTTGLIVSACYAVGNILQADPKYIQLIIESEIFPPIIEHMHEGEFKVKRSAVCVLSHARELNHQQIEYLASIGCIAPL